MYKVTEIFATFSFRMGTLHLAIVKVIISLSTLLTVAVLNYLGYSIEKYDESPEIYYESSGVAVLYNVAWRTVAYVNLNRIDNETRVLRQYVQNFDALCQMIVIRNWTRCAHFGRDARERLNQLNKREGLLKEITGQETGGPKKRGECLILQEN